MQHSFLIRLHPRKTHLPCLFHFTTSTMLIMKGRPWSFFITNACISRVNAILKQPFRPIESPTCQKLVPYGSPMFTSHFVSAEFIAVQASIQYNRCGVVSSFLVNCQCWNVEKMHNVAGPQDDHGSFDVLYRWGS